MCWDRAQDSFTRPSTNMFMPRAPAPASGRPPELAVNMATTAPASQHPCLSDHLTFLLPASLRRGASRYVPCKSALAFSVFGGTRRPGWKLALPLCPHSHPHWLLGPAERQVCFPSDQQDSCPWENTVHLYVC